MPVMREVGAVSTKDPFMNKVYRIRRDRKAMEQMQDHNDPRHGTRTGYVYGCRCDRCKQVVKDEWRAFREWKEQL